MLRIIGGLVVYGLAAFGAYSGLQRVRYLADRVAAETANAAQDAPGEAVSASQAQGDEAAAEQASDANPAVDGAAEAQT